MTRQSTTPTAEPSAADALTATSTTALLRAAYALTHRLHETDGIANDRLTRRTKAGNEARDEGARVRAQRDLIDAEILRRTGDAS